MRRQDTSMLRALFAGLRTLFRRNAAERDLHDEVRHYLDEATREYVRAGMAPDAAARAARVDLGGVESTKERVRSAGWEARVDGAWRDVRMAARALRHRPAFAAVVILTLALGTGATTLMFSVVNAVMLRPLPYRDSGRLVLVWTDDVRRALHREATAYRTIADWRERSRSFSDVAFFTTQRVAPMTNNPGGRGRARTALVSGNLFGTLGVPAALGRTLSERDAADRAPVAVISHAFWQRWFAGAPDVVGKTLTVDDASKGGTGTLTVIGVMPPDFYFPDKLTEFWTPATTYWRFARESTERFPDWARRWTAVARLAPGVSVEAARAEMTRVGAELASTYPPTVDDFPGYSTTMLTVLDAATGSNLSRALWVLLGSTGLVLLVACANVANLLLARGATRRQEFALRRALGAGRGRLFRQLVIEHAMLAAAGGSAGVALALWGMGIARAAAGGYVPRIDELSVDARVLAIALGASMAAALVFGIVPALQLSGADPGAALKEGGGTAGSRRLRRSRGAMVLAECALAVVLLAGAGLLLKSLNRLLSVDPGFDARGVLAMRLEFPSDPPPTAEERRQTSSIAQARARVREQRMSDLLTRLRQVPGVEAAGFVDDLFVAGQGNDAITIPSHPGTAPPGELNSGAVSPGLFELLRVPLRQGRLLGRDDSARKIRALWSPVVTDLPLAEKERRAVFEPVVVNETFVRRYFPDEEAIGRHFCVDPGNKTYWYEIVGVVGDMRRQGLDRGTIPEYYGPYFPTPMGRTDLLVRVSGSPLALAPLLRSVVTAELPTAAIARVSTADAQLAEFSAERRLQTWLLAAFAALAVALAAVGVFGLVQYMALERTRELGLRLALGATPGHVLGLVLARGMWMPALGIATGLVAALALTRVMSHLLFEVTATDPLTFVSVGGLLALVAALASWLAARRVVSLDPLRALRDA